MNIAALTGRGAMTSIASIALLAALASGCRGGLGSTCRCAADCRSDLVCRAEGEKPLTDELCYKPGVSGLCVESDDVDDSGTPVELTAAPIFLDMPSKRDFQPADSISDSVSATGTTDTAAATDTTATSTGTTGTSTGDTSTGSPSTSDSSTSGSTGTSTTSSTSDSSTSTSSSTSDASSSGSSTGSSSGSSSSTT